MKSSGKSKWNPGEALSWLVEGPLVLLLVLIVIPLSVAAELITWLPGKRDLRRLKDDIKKRWIPEQKYMYLSYTKGTYLGGFIEDKILPKLGKHLVVNRWDPTIRKHVDQELDPALRWMESTQVRDSDGIYEASLVRIYPDLGMKIVFQAHALDDEDDQERDDVAKALEEQVVQCVDAWHGRRASN